MALSRSEILTAFDVKTETVAVPEWGGDVVVKTMSGAERDRWELSAFDGGKLTRDNLRARLLVVVLCDEYGNPLFDAAADVEVLGAKSAKALGRLFDVAQRLNGLSKSDVDDLAKNS